METISQSLLILRYMFSTSFIPLSMTVRSWITYSTDTYQRQTRCWSRFQASIKTLFDWLTNGLRTKARLRGISRGTCSAEEFCERCDPTFHFGRCASKIIAQISLIGPYKVIMRTFTQLSFIYCHCRVVSSPELSRAPPLCRIHI